MTKTKVLRVLIRVLVLINAGSMRSIEIEKGAVESDAMDSSFNVDAKRTRKSVVWPMDERISSTQETRGTIHSNGGKLHEPNKKTCETIYLGGWAINPSDAKTQTAHLRYIKTADKSYFGVKKNIFWKQNERNAHEPLQNGHQDNRKRRDVLSEKQAESESTSKYPLENTKSMPTGEVDQSTSAYGDKMAVLDVENLTNIIGAEKCVTPSSNTSNDATMTSHGLATAQCPSSPWPRNVQRFVQVLLSFKEFYKIRTITRWVCVGLAIPAIPLAFLSSLTFTNKRMENRLSGLLVTFNICEGLKTAFYIIHRVWKQILGNQMITWSSAYANYFMYVVTAFPDAVGRVSLLLSAIVSIDRFAKLVFPLKGLRWRVITYPKLAIALCVAIPFITNASNTLLMVFVMGPQLNTSQHFNHDQIVNVVATTDPYIFQIYGRIHIASSICFRYIPLAISIILNTIATISIYRQQPQTHKLSSESDLEKPKKRKRMSSSSSVNRARQNNTMIVVSFLLFSFLVVVKPLIRVFSMIHPTIGEGKREIFMYNLLNECALFFDSLAPTLNFITYWALSSNFRKSIRDIV